MTDKEALKLALDALENISTALREEDVLGSDIELMLNAIAAINEALAQPPLPVQPVQEPTDLASFKNFHRSLCARFNYTHDEKFWWRDLVSIEEHIAKTLPVQPAIKQGWDVDTLLSKPAQPPLPVQEPVRVGRDFSCKVCGNKPDGEGILEHGKGCYALDKNGGGSEFIADAIDSHLPAQEPLAWYHNNFGVVELSRIPRSGWKPLYTTPLQPEPPILREW